jgi:hypothetical protein
MMDNDNSSELILYTNVTRDEWQARRTMSMQGATQASTVLQWNLCTKPTVGLAIARYA